MKRLRSRETELRQEKSMHRSEEEKEQADLATQVSLTQGPGHPPPPFSALKIA